MIISTNMRMFSPEEVPMSAAMEEAEDAKMERKLIALVVQGGYTADQLRKAYYRVCGISEEELDPATEEVRARMQAMADSGFPLNRLARLVGLKEKIEDTLPKYRAFIDELNVTKDEKWVLLSIVEKLRTGHIECRAGGQVVGEFEMVGQGVSKERQAMEMMNSIRHILSKIEPSKKYEFSFEEK